MSLNVAIIGPGRSKQGTGPYIAKAFNEQGINVGAVVSSALESAIHSAKKLSHEYAINCHAYSSLGELLENETIDIVAICSPSTTHHQYLQPAIEAGCHIFCEKPFWWPATEVVTAIDIQNITVETTKLVQLCKVKNVVLQLNTHWPFTLPTYYQIFPQQNQITQTVKTFSMWLSPQSTNKNMVIDAAPHLLSMLYMLVGAGHIQNIESNYYANESNNGLTIEFDYLHTTGDTKVSLVLSPTDAMPKPAAYAINGKRVDRHVELANYLISLRVSDKQFPIVDPLMCSVKNFLGSIYSKSSLDETALIDGMTHLAQIYEAVSSN